jgi:hypothetical protein
MTDMNNKTVRRHDRDALECIPSEHTTTDAVRPMLAAVRRLGASIDALTELVKAKQRAKAEAKSDKRLAAIREYLQRPIKASALQTDGCRRPWRLRSTFRDESYSQ